MFNLDAGVITSKRPGGLYVVFCNRCDFDLGTMGLSTVRNAIFACIGRGGVLCPDCRKDTCDVCGIGFGEENLGMLAGPKGDVRGCARCALFVSQEVEKITQPFLGHSQDEGESLERALW